MSSKEDKQEISALVHKLFNYIDNGSFNELQTEVFTENVFFDVSSAGGGDSKYLSSKEVCAIFELYIGSLDANSRSIGDLIVTINGNEAEVFTTTSITHYKKGTQKGNTREFRGDYQLGLIKSDTTSWKINSFIYELHHQEGNIELT